MILFCFFLFKASEHIGPILRNGTRGRFGPVGHIFQKSHCRLRNYFIEEHFSVIAVFSHWKHGRRATGSEEWSVIIWGSSGEKAELLRFYSF